MTLFNRSSPSELAQKAEKVQNVENWSYHKFMITRTAKDPAAKEEHQNYRNCVFVDQLRLRLCFFEQNRRIWSTFPEQILAA